ncbi:LytTR family transcriptional regulator DNA-binding domain-containing protein [Zhouia spongiae]|uniref:LytTR family transcriptional regulator DNA-binding domain-containing protein n=1 Tax=Zhouia spongiae TaxID=2202721 RepID=A0ABY3YKH1_9FLAO|nr:LytTR family transcriptional regulator DNA-binding domain-containing protein [Zhouia spongiae]UNY98341.1 LytTR family transcriptional regulator DNA-binding domain-containing protein [Zhouia spongiae]
MKSYLIIASNKKTILSIENAFGQYSEFRSMGSTSCFIKATELLIKQRIDLVFINIEGFIGDAFAFMLELYLYDVDLPQFIALSSTKEQAYKAIKHGCFDYLTTPLSTAELHKSISRFQKSHKAYNNLICLKSYKDYQYLDTKEILFLKADNNTTDFHLTNGHIINAFKTLKTYESKLPEFFKRVHKSYIINTLKVSRIDFGKTSCWLRGYEKRIPFSKKFHSTIETIHSSLFNASY